MKMDFDIYMDTKNYIDKFSKNFLGLILISPLKLISILSDIDIKLVLIKSIIIMLELIFALL